MTLHHAVVWADHHSAQVLQFDAEQVRVSTVRAHMHHTAQHGSGVRAEHEFFAEVCGALDGVQHVLVTGSRTAVADLRRYVDKHQPQTAARVSAYEVVDHPSDKQLVAQARAHFLKQGETAGARHAK